MRAHALLGIVGDDLNLGPFHRRGGAPDHAAGGAAGLGHDRLAILGLPRRCDRVIERGPVALAPDHAFQFDHRRAVPVFVKDRRGVRNHVTDAQHVEIEIGRHLANGEIFITDIAPADDGNGAIDDKGLVVHAPVHPQRIERIAQPLWAAHGGGVEQPHMHVRHRVQRREDRVHPGDAIVVQQQPHPHAAFGGIAQRAQQHHPRHVVVPDVIHHVDRPLGPIGQQDPADQRAAAIGQRHHAALAGMGRQRLGRARPQRGFRVKGDRGFRRAAIGFGHGKDQPTDKPKDQNGGENDRNPPEPPHISPPGCALVAPYTGDRRRSTQPMRKPLQKPRNPVSLP